MAGTKPILVIGSDADVQDALVSILADAGLCVQTAAPDAMIKLASERYGALVVDSALHSLSSGELLADTRAVSPAADTDAKPADGDVCVDAPVPAEAAADAQTGLLDLVTENTRTHLAYLDRDFNFVWVNSTYATGAGHTKEELLGHNHFELFPHEENQAIFERVRETGEAFEAKEKPFEYADQPERGVTYWDWTLTPVKDSAGEVRGFVFSLINVTDEVRARQEVEKLRARTLAALESLEKSEERFRSVAETANDAIISIDSKGNVTFWNRRAAVTFGYSAAEMAGGPLTRIMPPELRQAHREGINRVLSTKTSSLIGQTVEVTGLKRDGRRIPLELSLARWQAEGEINFTAIVRDISSRKQAEQELQRARERLEKAYRREHRIADVLQRALIPEVTISLPGYEVAARYEPALQEAEVGGDFYDVFELPDGRVALVMGDVSGKGVNAAIYTAMTRYMLRAYAHEDPEPRTVMQRLNSAMCSYALGERFVTMFYGVLDPAQRTLIYTDAGHDQPLFYCSERGCVGTLNVTGRILGLEHGARYRQDVVAFGSGDVLLVYTDGITDARDLGQLFGVDGLTQILAAHAGESSRRLADHVFNAASKAGAGNLRDDAAVLVVKAHALP